MHSGPKGKSDLCVQRTDWTSDHSFISSFTKNSEKRTWLGTGSSRAFVQKGWRVGSRGPLITLAPQKQGMLCVAAAEDTVTRAEGRAACSLDAELEPDLSGREERWSGRAHPRTSAVSALDSELRHERMPPQEGNSVVRCEYSLSPRKWTARR